MTTGSPFCGDPFHLDGRPDLAECDRRGCPPYCPSPAGGDHLAPDRATCTGSGQRIAPWAAGDTATNCPVCHGVVPVIDGWALGDHNTPEPRPEPAPRGPVAGQLGLF